MTDKAFTLASNQYCGYCGSFDLVANHTSSVTTRVFKLKSTIHCYGCERRLNENHFANNPIRTLPLTFDDFFFQTHLRNEHLKKRYLHPVAHALGVSLIVCAITGLYVLKFPSTSEYANNPQLEWANSSVPVSKEVRIVKSLQAEFDQLLAD